MTPALRRAFRATLYEADGVAIRIGQRTALGPGAFVTAWNPWSRKMPAGWNDRMLARLRQAVRGRILGEGFGRGRSWSERHLLVAGDPRRLVVLARRFRQHAIVVVAPGRPARLVQAGFRAG